MPKPPPTERRAEMQTKDVVALLRMQIQYTRRLLNAHTRLVTQSHGRGAMSAEELLAHEELMREITSGTDAREMWLDRHEAS